MRRFLRQPFSSQGKRYGLTLLETYGLPADSRLEVYTEWLPETPEPERTPQPIAADPQTGRVTFADDMLRFGADTRLVRGRAFALQNGMAASRFR